MAVRFGTVHLNFCYEVRYAGTVRFFIMIRVRYVGTVRFFVKVRVRYFGTLFELKTPGFLHIALAFCTQRQKAAETYAKCVN